MFNLAQAIDDWRRGLAEGGVKSPEFLDELESHLRDDIEDHLRQGLSVEEAFSAAASRLGKAGALKQEFNKAQTMNKRLQKALSMLRTPMWTPHVSRAQLKHTVLTLAGVPGQHAQNKETMPGIEPGWATYLRGLVLMSPAILIWVAARTILMPKLREIWPLSGFEMPSALRQVLAVTDVTVCYWWVFAGAAVGALSLFEWQSSGWPRFRRATMGMGVFLLNICALLSLMAIGILALIAASKLATYR